MDLWIRTQDRKNLIKVNKLHLCAETKFTGSIYDSDTKKEYTGNYFIESEGNKLGVYYSKERALEVLDEIQKILIGRLIIKTNRKVGSEDLNRLANFFDTEYVINDNDFEFIQPEATNIIYEMPKE